MKILTLNWTYKYGSTGKLICDIEQELKNCTFFHCYEYEVQGKPGNGLCLSGKIMSRVYNRTSKIKGLQYQNGVGPTRRVFKAINEFRPDIVHIHCPNGNTLNLYKILRYLKEHNVCTIITNHAEFFYTGNCAYAFECEGYLYGCNKCKNYKNATRSLLFDRANEAWTKMKEALSGFSNLYMVCVSDWQAERLRKSTICKGIPCVTIGNGIDIDIFCPREKKECGNKKIVLQVTSNFSNEEKDIKGGRYLIELAKKMQDTEPTVEFWVAGKNSLTDETVLPSNVKLLGEIRNQKELASLYSTAALTVLTSKRETFGMSCAESLCCGTPVAGFKNGGTESIAISEFCEFCEFGDTDELAKIILRNLNTKDEKQISEKAFLKYSKEVMAQKYYKLYLEALNGTDNH